MCYIYEYLIFQVIVFGRICDKRLIIWSGEFNFRLHARRNGYHLRNWTWWPKFKPGQGCLGVSLCANHHHHIVLAARISLTLSRHSSLSFIALGRSSGQQPVSSHSCWMYVRAGRPAFARPCVGIHKSTSLMSSSLLLQQCPACLVRLTWIVFVIGGRWPYSWCVVGCCCQDLGLECSPIALETWVQSQVESYQRLKKWYLMPPCLTLSIIRYGSRVK